MSVKLPEEQAKFIENWANKMNIKNDNSIEEWYFMPFYLKKISDNHFEIVGFEHIPKHVKDHIQQERN